MCKAPTLPLAPIAAFSPLLDQLFDKMTTEAATVTTTTTTTVRQPTPARVSPIPFSELPPRKCRRVHFPTMNDVCPISSPLDRLGGSDDDNSTNLTAIWYHKSEIVAFRDESRAESRIVRMRAEDVAENSTTTTTTQAEGESIGLKKCTLALDGATRGLEQRACLERQRRKFISQRIIYKAAERFQNDVNGPERLADLAAKVNAWATKLAIEEGARDSLRALVDNELTFSLQLTAPITEVTENHSLKRAASEDEGTDCVKRLRPTLVCG